MMSLESFQELLYGSASNLTEQNDYLRTLIINQTNKTFNFDSEIYHRHTTAETVLLITAYSLLGIVSILGNLLVCYVIFKNKRLYTPTNFFLANLAISDLLVTLLNVPFNIARNLLDEWPFGDFLCHLVNFSLILSVYVSTYTLTVIALDRHRVVVKPFTSRLSKTSSLLILLGIWLFAICLALPYGIYNTVEDVTFFVATVRRCRSRYPSVTYEQYLTILTIVLQYCGPLTIIGIAYGRIVHTLWVRTHVGAVTECQQISQAKAKRKSIKLLITVVIVFAICWLPLNLYHVLTDFHPNVQVFHYNSRVFFACHWIAISSTCYNPFVYCWLNDSFRQEVVSRFRWCLHRFFRFYPFADLELFLMRCNCRKRYRQESMRSTTRSSLGSSGREVNIVKRDTGASNSTDREEAIQVFTNGVTPNSNGPFENEEMQDMLPSGVLVIQALISRDGSDDI
ncbi:G-protein coupled receptor 83-like [Patella vulgata]|uniref:G-protein coupled receptor 83-like n=1 Tax=Patella vulgata TaxID=6465 RepID=UPI00218009AF|nr:G-protein coupled receptor 83-like [Patella vulgata]